MSNPFDQFSSDLSSALPPQQQQPQPTSPYGAPTNPYGMGPPMGGETNLYAGSGGYGGHQPAPPLPPPTMNDQYSNYGAAAPPTPVYGTAPETPSAAYNDPWGSSNGMGGPPPPPGPMTEPTFSQSSMASPNPYGSSMASPNPYTAAAAPVTPNPYGMPGVSDSSAYGVVSPPPVESNPYGAPPTLPTMNNTYGAPPTSPPNPYGMPVPASEPNPYGVPTTSTTMSDPNTYGMPPQQLDANPYGAAGGNQYGAPSADPNSYGAAPQMETNPYGAAPSETNPYGAPPPETNLYGTPQYPPSEQNPYGAPTAPPETNAYGAPPAPPENNNPYGAPTSPPDSSPYGAPQYPPPDQNPYGAPPPSDVYPYGAPPPPQSNLYGAAPTDASNPYGAPYGMPPSQPNPYGAPPPPPQLQQQQSSNPYGAPPVDQNNMMALVPAQQQSNPYAQAAAGYGQQQPPYQTPYGYGAPPPPPPPPIDPFSVFETQKPPAPAPAAPLAIEAATPQPGVVDPSANDDDFWGSFGPPSAQAAAAAADAKDPNAVEQPVEVPERRMEEEKKSGDDSLPPGGEWYDARIFTPTLGVMFFKPQELTDSLYLNTDKEIIEGLGDRPVVAFIVEGSSARSASVELGHVLLKVNGINVKNPKEASRLIKEGPRPLPLVFYIPKTDVVVAEGEHMVKYDSKETVAPNSAKDWKPKYVVIGGIIAQPWMMNMYRSKSEYDIAVIETQARRPVSVKVKQFSLQGARIQNDWQGPQIVKYKNKLHPWKFICILPVAGNPIKISSPNLSQLKPVHEGIRRVLLAQQRVSGGRQSGGGGGQHGGGQHGGGQHGGGQHGGGQRPTQHDQGRDDRYRNDQDAQYDNRRNHNGPERPGYTPQQQQTYGY